MGISAVFARLKRIRLLPPRDQEFFGLMGKLTDTAAESSHWLTEMFNGDPKRGQEFSTHIENCLTKCAQVAGSIEALLLRSQQPPFARTEIGQFSTDTLRIVKFINHAANRYVVYDIPSSDKEMRELGVIIKEACDQIVEAVKSLRSNRNIDPFARAVDKLETKADEIYHGGLRRRFQEIRSDRSILEAKINDTPRPADSESVITLIAANVEYTRHVAVFFILRQVYAELERAIDACTDATGTLKRMVADNV
ncbi:MAG: DUF47 family protein [Candidatus Zixiibacteriota bacterium]